MQEHTHTGIVSALYITAVAVVGLNLLRYAAIKLDDYPSTVWLSKVIGSTINFSGVK